MPKNTIDAFWKKVEKTESCWNWQGCIDADGYGRFQYKLTKWKTHRLSYHIHKGLIPLDLCVCHSCDNPRCVNPDHLWLGTTQDNTKDRTLKGRTANKINGRHAKIKKPPGY